MLDRPAKLRPGKGGTAHTRTLAAIGDKLPPRIQRLAPKILHEMKMRQKKAARRASQGAPRA